MLAMLKNLDTWIDDAVAYAGDREFDPNVLLTLRLHADMHPFTFQVQAATDAAKFAFARLAGKEAPSHPDTETTLEELRARLRSVIEYLEGFGPDDFEGAGERVVKLSFLPPGKVMLAGDYLTEMAMPNFFFHVTTAYALLRHAGVKLGKRRYIQTLTLQDA
ncbi:MAG: DUF1993 domain-containing protein [Sandaracinaceae bacterium]|nr:DUF1993 domain-containing protein [Sandaracinaceae bacterium]